ncbi:MAG: acyl-CoA dehydrogenase C-terminal domain-containing protein [Pseudomonadales bacterium]
MSEYNAPLKDMKFVIHELADFDGVSKLSAFEDVSDDLVDPILDEAARFAREVWGALNGPGDQTGSQIEDQAVVVPAGFAEAYGQFVEGGWQSLGFDPEFGGMGLPELIAQTTAEMWQAANMAFSLCPLLNNGAVTAIQAHASEELKQTYLPKMVSGEWSGTMNLTESQAGSDLAAVRSKAVPEGDHYRISGTKIFITWGDQPFTDNIVHLVLARLPDAPPGVKGISLFLVPKYLLNADGSIGELNDAYPVSVEHKLGIHASPTCVMSFGENEGAIGYLVGEENNGLACMFTMMNHARLGVGIQGLGICERSYQAAKAYASERVQGKAPGVEGKVTIVHHPDVRRMLMQMKAFTEAMRALAYVTATTTDFAHHCEDPQQRKEAHARTALLTPVVKAWMTEVAQEVTSLGVQIHGGMGFVEETGAAQHMRDARILTIYEGTTGIQANDLVGRKILLDGGKAMEQLLAEMRALDADLAAGGAELDAIKIALAAGTQRLEQATNWLLESAPSDPNLAGSSAFNILMLTGTVAGGWQMARAALVASRKLQAGDSDAEFYQAKLITTRFYAQQIMPRSAGYFEAAMASSESTMAMPETSF